MPLAAGSSRETISKNIEEMIRAGHDPKQAEAAAYANAKKTGRDDGESRRVQDINGWFEVDANPLSKVGVFQYSGKFISKDLDPNQMFSVFRPPEELADPECIESFKLVPWTDDHPRRLLGDPERGGIAPEEKGIEGVIGERVFFDEADLMLKGNIKVFSIAHAGRITSGKEELSVGYQCKYEYAPGEYMGQPYQYIQRQIRGNHVASVHEGRMGPDVAVLDGFNFTIDGKEFVAMKKTNKLRVAMNHLLKYAADAEENPPQEKEEIAELAQLQALLEKAAPIMEQLTKMHAAMNMPALAEPDAGNSGEADPLEVAAKDAEEAKKEEEAKAAKDAEEAEKLKAAKDAEEAAKDGKTGEGMDAKEIRKIVGEEIAKAMGAKTHAMDAKEMLVQVGQRDKLANQLSHFIGVFDHSEMTLPEVEVYGCAKLGIKAKKGLEGAALAGYLHGRAIPKAPAHVMDSKEGDSGFVSKYVAGEKK